MLSCSGGAIPSASGAELGGGDCAGLSQELAATMAAQPPPGPSTSSEILDAAARRTGLLFRCEPASLVLEQTGNPEKPVTGFRCLVLRAPRMQRHNPTPSNSVLSRVCVELCL